MDYITFFVDYRNLGEDKIALFGIELYPFSRITKIRGTL